TVAVPPTVLFQANALPEKARAMAATTSMAKPWRRSEILGSIERNLLKKRGAAAVEGRCPEDWTPQQRVNALKSYGQTASPRGRRHLPRAGAHTGGWSYAT